MLCRGRRAIRAKSDDFHVVQKQLLTMNMIFILNKINHFLVLFLKTPVAVSLTSRMG